MCTPRNCQDHQNQEKSQKLPEQMGTQGDGRLNVTESSG